MRNVNMPKFKTRIATNAGDFFGMKGDSILLEEKDLGIFNGMLTVNTPYTNVLGIGGMWAPPYLSSDFSLDVRLFGDIVKSTKYSWLPCEIKRQGKVNGIDVSSSLVLADGCRGGVLAFELTNKSEKSVKVPLQINLGGTFARNEV